MKEIINRRGFLLKGLAVAGLGAGLLPGLARAEDWSSDDLRAWREAQPKPQVDETDPNVFVFSRFRYLTLTRVQDQWDAHPPGDENVLAFLRNATNIKVSNRPWRDRVVGIDEYEKIERSPFLFMTGEGDFKMSTQEAATLGEFFKRGGFLYADDCIFYHNPGYSEGMDYFYRALEREIQKAMPGHQLQPVPPDHEIYHCFFDFPGRAPRCHGRPHPDLGLFYKNRMVAFLTAGDLHCGWCGYWYGRELHEQCIKMAINIIVYALTH